MWPGIFKGKTLSDLEQELCIFNRTTQIPVGIEFVGGLVIAILGVLGFLGFAKFFSFLDVIHSIADKQRGDAHLGKVEVIGTEIHASHRIWVGR